MRTIDARSFTATIAAAALIGVVAGLWSAPASTASAASARSSGYCDSLACESMTWLRMPALRRAR